MTVRELLELLAEQKPDLQIVLQKDAEGNGYSPLAGGERAYYVPRSTWSGEMYSQEDIDNSNPEEQITGGQDVLVLWPIN